MPTKRKIRFGIIGCGLMGREFAVASARWPALIDMPAAPEIVAICDLNDQLFGWYKDNFDSIRTFTTDYGELLSDKDIEFIYCAVPHNLHEKLYVDIIQAGKHLLGEKPFGIDFASNQRILSVIERHPDVFVRCSSEFPFFPAGHRIQQHILENPWGRIIEVHSGYLHSSDLNFQKPINWKRMTEFNGEYGCLSDLGMHAMHIPIRARWIPKKVFATLSKIVSQRPDGRGEMVPCRTWDNGTILCEVDHPEGYTFPMTLKTYRIAPGETDTWYIKVIGTKFSAKFSTKFPKTLQTLHYKDGAVQEWRHEDVGYVSAYKTITGPIFEFGLTDAILQMWAALVEEFVNRPDSMPFGCITPEETSLQHQILTAALRSGKEGKAVKLDEIV